LSESKTSTTKENYDFLLFVLHIILIILSITICIRERRKSRIQKPLHSSTIATFSIIMSQDLEEQARALYRGGALAPMVRASSTPLRALALHYGANVVYSEELMDRSIAATKREVNDALGTIDYIKDTSQLSKKTIKRLERDNRPALLFRIDPKLEANKLIGQLGTGEPELALSAARHIYQDVSAIDINMGCPKKFSVSGGMGSALLNDPDRASRIIKALRAEIPRPISCKIRLLKDTASTVEFVEAMINAGAHAIAIHARRTGDDSIHPADWNTLEEVLGLLRPKYPTFPFLVNGDFYKREEIEECLRKTGANGVLLARPALYNASMFRPMTEALLDKTTVVQEYLQRAVKYDVHYKNTKYVIGEMMNNRRAPSERVPFLPQLYPGGQTIAKTCNCQSLEELCQVWNVNLSDYNPYTTPNKSTPLAPGEHRYEDSYFMNHQKRDESASAERDAKRLRVEECEEKKVDPAVEKKVESVETTTDTSK
jgi:tRNA-dihydrouridine synthase 2